MGTRVAVAILVLIFALPTMWIIRQQIGPRADGPTEDPDVRRDREFGSNSPNAATHYRAAFELLTPPPFADWEREIGRTNLALPGELVAWVHANEACVAELREATKISTCYFARSPAGLETAGFDASDVRTLHKFLSLRATVASKTRDLAVFEDCVHQIERIARHLYAQPGGVSALLQGTGTLSIAVDRALWPFDWEGVDPAALRGYAERAAPIFIEQEAQNSTWDQEREDAAWRVETEVAGLIQAVVPMRRVFGEIDARLAPVREFAARSVVAQFANGHVPKETSLDMWAPTFGGLWNFPHSVAIMAVPNVDRCHELRARLIAMQRGGRAALAVLRYQLDHARPPSRVADVLSPEPLEPFTGRPFIYRVTESGFSLYAAGWDRDDDGGLHHGRFGEPTDREARAGRVGLDGDYVFWPLPAPDDTDRLEFRAYRETQAREAAEEARYESELREAAEKAKGEAGGGG